MPPNIKDVSKHGLFVFVYVVIVYFLSVGGTAVQQAARNRN